MRRPERKACKAAVIQALRYHYRIRPYMIAQMMETRDGLVAYYTSKLTCLCLRWEERRYQKEAIAKARQCQVRFIQKRIDELKQEIERIQSGQDLPFLKDTPIDLRPTSRFWEVCNRCGYPFKKKASGDVSGPDVIRHKEECRVQEDI